MDGFQDKEFMSNNDLELDKQSERVLDDLAANELASDENLRGAPKESDTENGESSSFKFVECGIPQGSCLGPLLFIIYINDLPNTLKNITPSIFADDTGISVSSDSVPDIQRLLREDISAIQRWMHENKLTLNALKTEFILIASKPRLKEIEETYCIEVQGETIYRAPYVKSLGFYIDQNLDWDVHVDHVIKRPVQDLQSFEGLPIISQWKY